MPPRKLQHRCWRCGSLVAWGGKVYPKGKKPAMKAHEIECIARIEHHDVLKRRTNATA